MSATRASKYPSRSNTLRAAATNSSFVLAPFGVARLSKVARRAAAVPAGVQPPRVRLPPPRRGETPCFLAMATLWRNNAQRGDMQSPTPAEELERVRPAPRSSAPLRLSKKLPRCRSSERLWRRTLRGTRPPRHESTDTSLALADILKRCARAVLPPADRASVRTRSAELVPRDAEGVAFGVRVRCAYPGRRSAVLRYRERL
jgi:hypothetical protein